MKKSEIILTAIFVGLLLISNPTYGQKKKDAAKQQETQPVEVVEEPAAEPQLLERNALIDPTSALNSTEQAIALEKEGWKAGVYNIASQLNSSWKLISMVDEKTFIPVYWWAECTTTGPTADNAKNRNLQFCCKNMLQQASAIIVLTSQKVLANHKITTEQKEKLMNCISKSTEGAVVSLAQKSMEIYQEKDNQVTVRTIMVVDKSKLYDLVQRDCKRRLGTGENPDFFPPIVDDIFRSVMGK